MSKALKMADISEEEIDMINCHATSTLAGDEIEARSIGSVFEKHKPYITANKGSIGHTFGAAGSIEMVFTVKSLQ